jgi:hypothetical protein
MYETLREHCANDIVHGVEFRNIVMATDLVYIVDGATTNLAAWEKEDFREANGSWVTNTVHWKNLLSSVWACAEHKIAVQFWLIPEKWNELLNQNAQGAVDLAVAKDAAAKATMASEILANNSVWD